MVRDVQNWAAGEGFTSGYGGYISVAAGNDMEADYATYTVTAKFITGYDANNSIGASLVDYGSAYLGNGWTLGDVWIVAYGDYYEYPLPEIYLSGQVATWVSVATYAPTVFYGTMASYPYQNDLPPVTAWDDLWTGLNNAGVNPNMTALTNI
jgi:hypothetical protein